MKNKVRNTTQEVRENPELGLAMSMFGGGIEASEKRGQDQLVESEVLPAKMSPDVRKTLEGFGIVFGDKVEGDDLFVYATLPGGWKKVSTNHSMWSNLLDERGRERASIFYKAAFYDRDSFLHLRHRFQITSDYPELDSELDKKRATRCIVKRGNEELYNTGWVIPPEGSWKDLAHEKAEAFLNDKFPKWKDPGAYWDE